MTAAIDIELADAIGQEARRQQDHIELIASENIVSAAVRAAQGTILTNKYAEGYPGYRYYGGCEAVDRVEQLAIDRSCRLFGAAHANVQAHSGANANIAVLFALLDPGDRIMGLDLACGGHLTHGSPVSLSGRWFNVAPYSVREDNERIDYDQLDHLAREARPRLIFAGGSAYPREIDFARMRAIADAAGAWLVADVAHYAGLIAAGLYPNPVPHAHVVTSTTHKTLRGPRGGLILTNDATLAKKIDKAVFPGTQGGPLMHVIAAKAASFHEALQPAFVDYARAVVANARVLGDVLMAGGLHLVTGGTDCHLLLVDLRPFGITGKAAVEALERFGLTANKNAVPFDPLPPTVTSGIRLGTPAATSRGFDEAAFREVGALMLEVLGALQAGQEPDPSVRERVRRLTEAWPVEGGAHG
ncbi:serine hydroxymethyltransferase [Agrobacterium tumefaciens]|uniref:serine hydroxymethyltransferase n=1 Tax=Agrobacterium tumefaciens complex TaxID=1183400 RepID=UPI00298EEC3A|nr:serine hydroxymethyltransferase [Agrobacterium fabrum]NSZ09687.1 serine hydroxymethyltransferase [Agrobacterium tumefaciens]